MCLVCKHGVHLLAEKCMLVLQYFVLSLNFVECDCSIQGNGGNRAFFQNQFICLCCFESVKRSISDVVYV